MCRLRIFDNIDEHEIFCYDFVSAKFKTLVFVH
jgi:hypothetical protein